MKLQIIKQVSYKGDIKTYGKNKDKLLLYLFQNSNLKEIDIYIVYQKLCLNYVTLWKRAL